MKRYRSSLPPLDALIFFEAAARENSFTRSAAELNVTQAAVSKRIRELEAHLGVPLFERRGRKLVLTRAGAALHDKTVMALEFLDSACKSLRDDGGEIVRIAANTAISHFWLGPRLKTFGLTDPPPAVEVRTSDRLSDIVDGENDLAVIYGYGDTPGWECTRLFPERLVAVASPDYLQSSGLGEQGRLDRIDGQTAARLVLLNFRSPRARLGRLVGLDRKKRADGAARCPNLSMPGLRADDRPCHRGSGLGARQPRHGRRRAPCRRTQGARRNRGRNRTGILLRNKRNAAHDGGSARH